ncbi:MAG: nucleotide exchange factor GrpE [Puniceicoccales bacterium]|jgi:molecular chaperone GrpE|nr:nucleotide exchange factor GrpE [Puniceicoccales bacterium]
MTQELTSTSASSQNAADVAGGKHSPQKHGNRAVDGPPKGDHGHAKRSSVAVGDLLKELDDSRREATECRDGMLRALADLDNYKKRAQKERVDIRNGAILEVIEGLLPVLDNFEFGLSAAEQHGGGSIADGFRMIFANFKSFLSSHGVCEISPLHEKFDVNFHHCVRRVVDDSVDADIVVAVDRKGYTLNGKLLRPAAVAVSQRSEQQQIAE